MRIGTVVNVPEGTSQFATVRDEYGSTRTVHANEIDEDAEEGDELAYQVSFFRNSGNVTLINDED